MNDLPDSLKLSKISIPGTHDSATQHALGVCTSIGAGYCLTQHMKIPEQLSAGIRFFDIRLKQDSTDKKKFYIYHDRAYLDITLKEVLEIFKFFLKQHPTEVIILSYQNNDHDDVQDWFDFTFVVRQYSGPPHNLICLKSECKDQTFTPTLGQVRGKVVLLNYMEVTAPGSRAFRKYKLDEIERTVENTWKRPEVGIIDFNVCHSIGCKPPNGKRCGVREYLNRLEQNIAKAGEISIPDRFYITYSSYAPANDPCRNTVAKELLKTLNNQKAKNSSFGTGVIVMDFPSREMINTIIRFNYQGTVD